MVTPFAEILRQFRAGEIEIILLQPVPDRQDYVFFYDRSRRMSLVEQLAVMAADSELELTWWQAGQISMEMVRREKRRAGQDP